MSEIKHSKYISQLVCDTAVLLYEHMHEKALRRGPLFVLYDAGETLALEPVFAFFRENGLPFRLLAFGTAETLVKDYPEFLGLGIQVDRLSWPREQELDSDQVEHLLTHCHPTFLVSGMVSGIQRQLAEKFRAQGVPVVAYYDSFSPLKANELGVHFLDLADQILVPSEEVAESVRRLGAEEERVELVGQPTLDGWLQSVQNMNRSEVRKNLGVLTEQLILYAGGYGRDYEEAFEMFCLGLANIQEIRVIVALHPKSNGKIEKGIIDRLGISCIEFLSREVSTVEAVCAADLIVTQRSSVGVQAHFIGRDVLYVDLEKTHYSNSLIESKQVDRVLSAEALDHYLFTWKPKNESAYKISRETLGSAKKIYHCLQKWDKRRSSHNFLKKDFCVQPEPGIVLSIVSKKMK
ncbi:MAG: hypothetical protein CMO81_01890 [Waddliaceae bacterium]|nr:hypothetical protein [Waddliaceae bacterium]